MVNTFLICNRCGSIKSGSGYNRPIISCCDRYDYSIATSYGETDEECLIRWVRYHYRKDGSYVYRGLNNRGLSVKRAKEIMISKLI